MPFLSIFSVPNMSFNAIRKNKILVKINRFTVVGQKIVGRIKMIISQSPRSR